MNDIQLNAIEVAYELPQITAELAPLRESVAQIVKQYQGFVVGEDDVDAAKKIVTQLNKTAKSLSDKRIEIARTVKAPIDAFEDDLKALTEEIKRVSEQIKTQTDDYEAKRKHAKKQLILQNDAWLPYMNFDETWLNKTAAIETILDDLAKQRTTHDSNELLIKSTCGALGLESVKYVDMLDGKVDINAIIAQIKNDDDVRKRYANKPVETPQTPTAAPGAPITPQDTADTDVYTMTLRFTTTKTKLKMLRQFVDANEIKYEKVE
jgi:hypothetical protein